MNRGVTDRFSALYFPYINIRDESWLKSSLLLWNSIYRIIPHGYPQERSYEYINQINRNDDIIRPVYAESYTYQIEENFIDFIESNLIALERFKFNADIVRDARRNRISHGYREAGINDKIPGVSFIYSEKMGRRLQEVLIDNDLGILARDDDYSYMTWVGVDKRVANLYMTALANVIAYNDKLNPITDSGPHLSIIGNDFEASAKILLSDELQVNKRIKNSNIYDEMLLLTIRRNIPADISSLTFEQILDFRNKRSKEIKKFQKYISDTVKAFEIGKDNLSESALKDWLKEEILVDLNQKVAEIDEAYRDLQQDLVPNLLNIKFSAPAITSTIASTMINSPALIVSGAAISLIPLIRKSRGDLNQVVSKNPAAFLYHLRGLGGLNKENIRAQINYRTRNFIFGE